MGGLHLVFGFRVQFCLLARAECNLFSEGRAWIFLLPSSLRPPFQSTCDQRAETEAAHLEQSFALSSCAACCVVGWAWSWSRTQAILQHRRVKFCVCQTWAQDSALPFLSCYHGCTGSSQPHFPLCKMVIKRVHGLWSAGGVSVWCCGESLCRRGL